MSLFIRFVAGLLFGATALVADIVINEIHPSPDVDQERVEFVELFNTGGAAVSLDGWRLSGGVAFTFPAGTSIAPGGYLVVSENPAALASKFGLSGALGPWVGRLAGGGERLNLRNAADAVVDTVGYGRGFPWPTVGDAPGYSMELVNPGVDNDLGGHWRASVANGAVTTTSSPVLQAGSIWRYLRGTSAPSSPVDAWRQPGFNDSAWSSGPAPIGYDPAVAIGTRLDDMNGSYVQAFLRTRFNVTNAAAVGQLRFEALYDDGFILWINGTPLVRSTMPDGEVSFATPASGTRENDSYERFDVTIPPGLLRDGENTVAVQLANILLSGSSDCFFDLRIFAVTGPAARGPTPGRINAAYVTNPPPALRQLDVLPKQPRSGEPVRIQVKATDSNGVAGVELEYQAVDPGAYIRFDSAAYATNWTRVVMNDQALEGDAVAGDGIYTVTLPANLQVHRRFVRYRITARDRLGAEIRAPYSDDEGRNFAYFCYDGVPAWTGAVRPGFAGAVGTPFTVPPEEMNRLPAIHLIALRQDVENSTWLDRSRGDQYFWTGTLVYDGVVYDHIRFRPRGGVWRYAMGKNMWKFDFNRGRDLEIRDNWGTKLATPWSKLNLGACIQQGDYEFRGEQGMFESVGFKLFQLAQVPGSHSTFTQFRIIDDTVEAQSGSQYGGDFWGLYLAVEQLDGRYLEEHGLPDGNLYKMEGGFGDPNNLGPDGPVDSSDLRSFLETYNGSGSALNETWWRTNLNLPAYFGYQAVVQTIHHYDIADGKNYFYYRNPEDGRWQVLPWDLDLTWADSMYRGGQQGGDEPFKSRVLNNFQTGTPRYPGIAREFRNRIREFRDLLMNTDEGWRLIDEYARLVRGTNVFSIIDADRAQWDYNPIMINPSIVQPSKAGQGRFYQRGTPTRDFPGMVQWMKNYLGYRSTNTAFSLDTISVEPQRPAKPSLSYTGPAGFPLDRLSFQSSSYQGTGPFASVKWRIAEISRTNHPAYRPSNPQPYEIQAVWESPEYTNEVSEISLPPAGLRAGRLYRVRARHTDSSGRASNWSDPVEFTTGNPVNAGAVLSDIRLTEIMYNPPPDGFEFVELHNTSSSTPVDLGAATFTAGISFSFPTNTLLAPEGYVLVTRTADIDGFRQHYDLDDSVPVFGPYSGALANEGETLTFRTSPGGALVFTLAYGVEAPWPTNANGGGYSIVPVNPASTNIATASAWRSSGVRGGSPGRADQEAGPIRLDGLRIESGAGQPALRFSLSGTGGGSWVIETSTDLRVWTPRSTNAPPSDISIPVEGPAVYVRAKR
jgi:hypothetical protein